MRVMNALAKYYELVQQVSLVQITKSKVWHRVGAGYFKSSRICPLMLFGTIVAVSKEKKKTLLIGQLFALAFTWWVQTWSYAKKH